MVTVVGIDESMMKKTTCKNCGSKLEYFRREIKQYTHHDYGGGSDIVRYITCPTCNEEVTVG